MTQFTGRGLDISTALNGQLAVNSAGNEIPTTAHLHESFLPADLTPAMLKMMQEFRNDLCAGFTHNTAGLMADHFTANPGDGQITAALPFGMDTFNVTGTMNNGSLHFVTAYQTNGGQPMFDIHAYLTNMAEQIAKA